MLIAVCIKQVPTRDWQPRLNDDKTWIREQDAGFEMNEPDQYALEAALRLKEKHGGEVVVCSAGPARVAQVIREALARGADISVMSLTKHVGGHSDLMLGSASAGAQWYAALRRRAQGLGLVVSPDDAALALRGLRTMALRLERETASALAIAQPGTVVRACEVLDVLHGTCTKVRIRLDLNAAGRAAGRPLSS